MRRRRATVSEEERTEVRTAAARCPSYAMVVKCIAFLPQAVASLASVSLLLKRPGAYSNTTKAASFLARAKQLFEFAKTLNSGV